MKTFLANLIRRMTSRKFLLTVSAALVLVANQQWPELAALILGYISVEGLGDATERFQAQKVKQAETNLEDTKIQFGVLGADPNAVDRGDIVPGNEVIQ